MSYMKPPSNMWKPISTLVDGCTNAITKWNPKKSAKIFAEPLSSLPAGLNNIPSTQLAALTFINPPLDWGRQHHLASLTRDEQARIDLRCEDVLTTQPPNVDIIFALNFSFCVFKQRDQLLTYFKNVRSGLKKNGLFILDIYGGTESIIVKNNEVRDIPGFTTQQGIDVPNFEYIWDQAAYNPINHHTTCHIHFNVPGIKRYTRAFTYHWRLWTLPELREIMQEAGFSKSEVYLHDFDENGESDEHFRLRSTYENAEGWIAYLVGVTS